MQKPRDPQRKTSRPEVRQSSGRGQVARRRTASDHRTGVPARSTPPSRHRSVHSAPRRRARRARARSGRGLLLAVLLVLIGVVFFRSLGTGDPPPAENVIAEIQNSELPSAAAPLTPPASSEMPVTEPPATDSHASEPSEPNESNYSPRMLTYAKKTAQTKQFGASFACRSGILINVTEDTVIAARDESRHIYPASLTKVMTLITARDLIRDPVNERFVMTYEILHPLITSGNSLAGFEVGESAPLLDYYYGMIMASGADAAEGIAVYCSGSVEAFVHEMNRKAAQLGLKNSHFTNPVGEHDAQHYSTVHDMALILGYAYEDELLAKVLSTYQYTTAPTALHPQGLYFEASLQQRMHGDESETCTVLGGKTGYTPEAGNCVVCYARSNKTGRLYLFAAAGGKALYDPIWDCIHALADYVE